MSKPLSRDQKQRLADTARANYENAVKLAEREYADALTIALDRKTLALEIAKATLLTQERAAYGQ